MTIKIFQKGDVVYWCHQKGYEYEVHYGIVDQHFSDAVIIDYLEVKERRRINGIPISEFTNEHKYKKLPKEWSYSYRLFEITYDDIENITIDITNPSDIKSAYNKGFLVKKSQIFHGNIEADITKEGYRIIKKYPQYINHIVSTSVRPDKVYDNYKQAEEDVLKNRTEFERQLSLSEYEWSVEQIDKVLDRWQFIYDISNKEKLKYREWLLELDNIEDVETRLFDGNIQWKYFKHKKWSNIDL